MRARLVLVLGLAGLLLGCGQSVAQPFRADVHMASVAKTRIAWYERGQGPPLMLLIGTGSTMAEWDPALLRLLARDHRLVLFDYPGVGMSGPAATTHRQVAAEGPWLRSNRNYRQLAGVAAPTLAAAGAEDQVVPPVNLRRIVARVPHSKLVVLAGAHAFLFQERLPFTRVVDRFLSGRIGRGRP
jgi:pimeloyl-ACP methyl ester carboxylesterase